MVDRDVCTTRETKFKHILNRIKKQGFYQTILILMTLWAIAFTYIPIGGNIIAFKNYKINLGFFGSDWVGLTHYESFFKNKMTLIFIRNTFAMSALGLIFGTLCAIIFALLINELRKQTFKKAVQTISYLPYFISMAVCANIWIQFLSRTGPLNNMLLSLKIAQSPVPFLEIGSWFWAIITAQAVWKNVGWSSIIYLAAIAGISREIYEAAYVDGAGRFKQMWHITLPGMLPTICILLIMNSGSLLSSGFEQQLLMQNPMVMDYAEVIGTYVYKIGLGKMQYSYATAINLLQSVISIILVSTANIISKRLANISLW